MAIDTTLVKLARERLYTGVISDVLDTLGNWDHAMAPNVRPIDEGLALFGRARTGLYMSVYDVEPNVNPYEVEIALIDDLREDDVAVLGCPHGNRVAPWGELLSTASQARGAAGCVTDGLVRDLRLIREMKFPVFAGGIGPLDSKGRGTMMRMDVPIVCGGVRVAPGDWIFGDVDGVVVIPGALAEKTLTMAIEKAKSEGTVRAELKSGQLLKDVFARHGIL
jgi:4-hydroxy-4-methyl-2-oxoglutarate aldolase